MSRVIKFRAWDKPHSKMCYSVNLYQSTSDSVNRVQLYPDNFMKTPGVHCELMQFTGVKDNTGQDIYEGDIIHSKFSDGRDCNHVIEWRETGFVARFYKDRYDTGSLFSQGWVTEFNKVVIGNIYDNPELLTL